MESKEIKQARFVRVAEIRTNNVLDALDKLSACTRPQIYDYTPEQVAKVFAAIRAAVDATEEKFTNPNAGRFTLANKEEM